MRRDFASGCLPESCRLPLPIPAGQKATGKKERMGNARSRRRETSGDRDYNGKPTTIRFDCIKYRGDSPGIFDPTRSCGSAAARRAQAAALDQRSPCGLQHFRRRSELLLYRRRPGRLHPSRLAELRVRRSTTPAASISQDSGERVIRRHAPGREPLRAVDPERPNADRTLPPIIRRPRAARERVLPGRAAIRRAATCRRRARARRASPPRRRSRDSQARTPLPLAAPPPSTVAAGRATRGGVCR